MASNALFSVPITPLEQHPGGAITCTVPQPGVYLLTFVSGPDNRLTAPFLRALLAALDVIEFGGHPPGVVVTTSGIPKFYSNGLDLGHATSTEGFFPLLFSVFRRFLSYPMPTVALLNGHTFAGALMLATAHDYRLAPSGKGFLCLNEVLFGAPLRPAMAAVFRAKMPAHTCRTLALEGHRFTSADAVQSGLADGLAASVDDALRFIQERDLAAKAQKGVYGVIKAELYHDLIATLHGDGLDKEEARFFADQDADAERKEFGKVWYDQWSKENKAKL